MSIVKALGNFTRYTESILAQIAEAVLLAMTGNDYFETPNPTLETLQSSIQNFVNGRAAASTRDRVKIAQKK